MKILPFFFPGGGLVLREFSRKLPYIPENFSRRILASVLKRRSAFANFYSLSSVVIPTLRMPKQPQFFFFCSSIAMASSFPYLCSFIRIRSPPASFGFLAIQLQVRIQLRSIIPIVRSIQVTSAYVIMTLSPLLISLCILIHSVFWVPTLRVWGSLKCCANCFNPLFHCHPQCRLPQSTQSLRPSAFSHRLIQIQIQIQIQGIISVDKPTL